MVIFPASAHPASRRARNKADARRRLYEAALRLFQLRGYEAATIGEITTLAGTAKGTFFNYFPTKEHVLAAYHDALTGAVLDELESVRPESAEADVQRAMAVCAHHVRADPALGRLVVMHVFGSTVLHEAELANTRRFMQWFRARVEAGVVNGELRGDFDIEILLDLIAAVLSSSMNAWVMDPTAFDLPDALRRKTRFLFDAARAG